MQKRVMRILGAGIIIVVICGVSFFFLRGKDTAPVEEPVKQESIFIDENTVTDPADVEVERHWEEVISEQDLWLKTINDTYLHAEPFDDADTLIKVSINTDIDELACCFIGGESMGWSKVVHNGVTGYVNMKDAEYIMEDEEPAEVKELVEEVTGVSDSESIIDVEKPAEEAEATPTPEAIEPTPSAEPTSTPEVAEPTPSAEPQTTATPNPNVDTKTADEKQAEAQAEILKILESRGGSQTLTHNDGTNDHGFHGNGTKYGDLQ